MTDIKALRRDSLEYEHASVHLQNGLLASVVVCQAVVRLMCIYLLLVDAFVLICANCVDFAVGNGSAVEVSLHAHPQPPAQ
jgi:uncharacterized membrane protein